MILDTKILRKIIEPVKDEDTGFYKGRISNKSKRFLQKHNILNNIRSK